MIRILLVDDDPQKSHNIESMIIDLLPQTGIDIVRAATISEATNILSERHFDLMLLDLNLPMRYNSATQPDAGIKFLYHLARRNNIHTPTHIIGLTAFDNLLSEHQEHFHKSGWVLLKYEQNSDAWEKVISEKIFHILDSLPPSKTSRFSGMKYLLIFLTLLLSFVLVYLALGIKGFLVLAPIVLIAFYVICLFQLRNDQKLSEKGFKALNIMILQMIKSKLLTAWTSIFRPKQE